MTRKGFTGFSLGVSVIAAALSPTARAQETRPAESGGLEEIVVTAQKRSENLQDVPISMVALGPLALERRGVVSLGDINNATVPGVNLAPYPGSRLTTNAIARAGGLAHWQATPEELTDPEFRMWRWLQKPPPDFPVFVGYGTEDRFAEGMQQIAECFPPAARHALPGDHDWPVWQLLWERFLDSGTLPI